MQELFFELLRVAIGQMDCLSRGPSAQEWDDIYKTAKHHGLVGVCYKGIERLFDYGLRVPQDLSLDWMADAEAIHESQTLFDSRCEKLVKKLAERKIHAAVMNGIGARFYENNELQQLLQATSVDVFVDCSMDRAIKFAHQTGQEEIHCSYTSLALNVWNDTPVNLHYRVLSVSNSFQNRKMQKWFSQNKELMFKEGTDDVFLPSLTMNAVCMLQVFQQCLLAGEATMRQLVDYYFVLSRLKGDFQPFKNDVSMADTLQALGLTQFAAGVMWVLQNTMALNSKCMLCPPQAGEGHFILKELMTEKRSWWNLMRHYPMEMVWPRR